MKISVIKRSGVKESLTLEKWQSQIAKICQGIADVSQSMIEIKAQHTFMMVSLLEKSTKLHLGRL
jgi:hypothetical protein